MCVCVCVCVTHCYLLCFHAILAAKNTGVSNYGTHRASKSEAAWTSSAPNQWRAESFSEKSVLTDLPVCQITVRRFGCCLLLSVFVVAFCCLCVLFSVRFPLVLLMLLVLNSCL